MKLFCTLLGVTGFCRPPSEHGIHEVCEDSFALLLQRVRPKRLHWNASIRQSRHPKHKGGFQNLPKRRISSQRSSQPSQWLSNPLQVISKVCPGKRLNYNSTSHPEFCTQGFVVGDAAADCNGKKATVATEIVDGFQTRLAVFYANFIQTV